MVKQMGNGEMVGRDEVVFGWVGNSCDAGGARAGVP